MTQKPDNPQALADKVARVKERWASRRWPNIGYFVHGQAYSDIHELLEVVEKQREVLVMAREAIKGVTAFASAEAYQNGANAVTAVDNVMKGEGV